MRRVADRVGIEVREVETRTQDKDAREPFWELNAAAAAYFRDMLWDEDAGKAARDYLALRRVSREIADRFGLGENISIPSGTPMRGSPKPGSSSPARRRTSSARAFAIG